MRPICLLVFQLPVNVLPHDIGLIVTVVVGAVVLVGMSMFLFQQLAGINAVVYFSTQVFRSAGITSDVAASALVGAANVAGKLSTPGVPFYLLSFQVLTSNISFVFGEQSKAK